MKRRDFLQITGLAGTGLLLGSCGEAGHEQVVKFDNDLADDIEVHNYVYIDKTGFTTIVAPHPEMGQGVFHAIPMIIAEEMNLDIEKVDIIQADVDQKKFASQNVGGSGSIRKHYMRFRTIGATAKTMLLTAAAQKWNCALSDCQTVNGDITNTTTQQRLHFGQVAEAAAKLPVPKNIVLKKPENFALLGKNSKRKDIELKINGQAIFGIDVLVDDMLHASIERHPQFVGKVNSYNKEQVEAIQGVYATHIVTAQLFGLERQGVAILSKDYVVALNARKSLRVEWEKPKLILSDAKVQEAIAAKRQEKALFDKTINPAPEKAQPAQFEITAEYTCPYQAHATMEPPVATVWVKPDSTAEAWLPTQNPFAAQRIIAQKAGIKAQDVKINVTFLGCGLGRKSDTDFVEEAAELSAITKRPVKSIWKREDDIATGLYRPTTSNMFTAKFDINKQLVAFTNDMVAPNIVNQVETAREPFFPGWAFEGSNLKYKFPNYQTVGRTLFLPVPVTWWRSVYASTNGFATEAFVDEVAEAEGLDPFDFRKKYAKAKRIQQLLDKLRQQSQWDKPAANEYKGLAFVESFESLCAQVATVVKDKNGIRIKKYDAVIDCGQTINPDTVKAQVEGSIVMGLTAATKPGINLANGKSIHANFSTFHLLRINETPEIDVQIMPSEEKPGGVGEPGLPPVAAALANALYKATGKRYRQLPILLNEIS